MEDVGASLRRPYIFRDPVHGDITFARDGLHTLVRQIVDEEVFQRLRSIRQNGVLNLVFHGAEHSRFSHSLGAAHLAGRMYDAACQNSSLSPSREERKLTVLAALLHDVGHGPFSHLLEEVLGKKLFHHETMTARLLTEADSPICKHLREHDPELPEKLLPFVEYKKRAENHWYYALVSSQLDADRLDYTARDAMMAGVLSHRFDRDRLIGALYVWKSQPSVDDPPNEELAVDDRALDVIENYLFALHHLYRSIYFHHTVRAASWLLNAALRRARLLAQQDEKLRNELFPDTGLERDPLWVLFEHGSRVPLSTYTKLDEPHVWSLVQRWRTVGDPTLQDLCNRLKQRRYLKAMGVSANLDESLPMLEAAKAHTRKLHPNLDADSYVHFDRIGRETYRPYRWKVDKKTEIGEKPILLLSKAGYLRPIEHEAESTLKLLDARFDVTRLLVLEEVRNLLHHAPGQG